MTEPSKPAFWAMARMGASMALRMISTPTFSSASVDLERVQSRDSVDQSHAAACDDALLDSSAGSLQGVLNAGLLLLELGLGGSAHLQHGHAAGQLGQALLELVTIEVGVDALQLLLDRG